MPLIEVKLWDSLVQEDTTPRLVARLTDAVCEVLGEGARPHTWVLVEGVPARQWGVAGNLPDGA